MSEGSHPHARRAFPTTRWSIVLDAGTDSADAGDALAELCRVYWSPVYAYARRTGADRETAEDLVQGFFAKLLEKGYVSQADPARGRFRTFILTSFKNFAANEWDRSQAAKRGGGQKPLSLDTSDSEDRLRFQPADHETPESIYAREWARALLEHVLGMLERDMAAKGKDDRFHRIKHLLTGESATSYRDLAAELEITEGALKVLVHRARKRFAALLRAEVAHSVGAESDVDDEIRFLFGAIRG